MSVSGVIIPLNNNTFFYTFKTTLSGILVVLTLRYNGRMDRWILNIDDQAGNQIISGLPLLVNKNLLSQYPTLNILPGTLMAVDVSQQLLQPTQFSFGVNNFLVYIS